MRLIDADALQKAIPDVEAEFFENCGNCNMLSKEDVLESMDDQPTVDAVPVIRCKDCKFRYWDDWLEEYFCQCYAEYMQVLPDDFCSNAERKEKNNERMG